MNNGELPSIKPEQECPCPNNYPIFKRNPHIKRDDLWRGTHCETIGGDKDKQRVDKQSYQLEFINDGDLNSYWKTNANERNKITIDLFTTYQVSNTYWS